MNKELWHFIINRYPSAKEDILSQDIFGTIIDDIYNLGYDDGFGDGHDCGFNYATKLHELESGN